MQLPRSRRAAVALALGITIAASGAACSSSGSGSAGAHLSVADFAAAADRPGTMVLDVRTPAEYASGHLPSAVNIDFQGADFGQRIATMDKQVTYAVYCHTGRRSGLALQQMQSAGFTHASDLDGGIAAWTAAGRPVVTGP